jgi:hypothetical protein
VWLSLRILNKFGIKLSMPLTDFAHAFRPAAHNAKKVAQQGFATLLADPTIVVYPLFVFLLVISTLTTVDGLILQTTNTIAHESFFRTDENLSIWLFEIVAVLASTIYAYMMVSYFTCLVSASVLGHLEGRSAPLLHGIKLVFNNFWRITVFAALSILLIPIGIVSQWHKLRKTRGTLETIGSSFSLNMAQLAPVILTEKNTIDGTIRKSVETMGKAWRENLILKVGIYLSLILLSIGISLNSNGIINLVLLIAFFVTAKIIGAVFTTVLYHQHASRLKL